MKKISGNLSLIIWLVLTVTLMSCAGSRTQENTGEYLDDSVITTRVKYALWADPDVKSLNSKCGNLQRGSSAKWSCQRLMNKPVRQLRLHVASTVSGQ